VKALRYLVILAGFACTATTCNLGKYLIGGTVTGLHGSGLVLENNSGDSLTITGNGTFTFADGVKNNDAYSVTVATEPSNPVQTCTVHNGSGTIDKAAITNVVVTCVQAGRFAFVADQTANAISAFAIDSSNGVLSAIDGSPYASGGTAPYSMVVDPNQANLYVANYSSNSVSVYAIDYDTGQLSSSGTAIATGNSPAAVVVDPSNSYLYVANWSDGTVSAYTISGGVATAIIGSPYIVGTNPFALAIDPSGNFLYVTNYGSNDVTVFSIGIGTGELATISGSPFGTGAGPVSIAIDPTGTFAYVANETADSISEFALNPSTGALTAVSGSPLGTGSAPESLVVAPTGSYVYGANVTSANAVGSFGLTATTGGLSTASTAAAGSLPLSVAVDPAGTFVYAANYNSGSVSVYSVSGGTLTAVSGSPFAADGGARSIAID
jgi:6-phosphogluconolactonase